MPPRKAKGSAAVKPDSTAKKTATSEQPEDIGNLERRIRRKQREIAKRRKLDEMTQDGDDDAQQSRPIDAVNAQQTSSTGGNAQVIDESRLKKRKTTMQTDETPAATEKGDESDAIAPCNAGDYDRDHVGQDMYQGSRACSHDHTFPEGYIHTTSCLSYSSTIKYITHSNEEGVEYDHALRPWKTISFTIEGKEGSVECCKFSSYDVRPHTTNTSPKLSISSDRANHS
jgi:TolA-binding protein